jgi:hypothetical protein
MESALELSVKLEVDIHTGKNWMDAKWFSKQAIGDRWSFRVC